MMQNVDDIDEVVKKVQAGDRDAFRFVVTHCEARIRLILASMLPRETDIEGLAQEVFVTAYLHLRDYQSGSDFKAWISSIARNHARNELRKWARDHEKNERYRAEVEETVGEQLGAMVDRLDEKTLTSVRACLDKLTPAAREVVWARYVEGAQNQDIATTHSKTEGWVRIVLFRSRQMLARCVRGEEEVPDVVR